jgi:hypothetical protein
MKKEAARRRPPIFFARGLFAHGSDQKSMPPPDEIGFADFDS